MPKTNLKRKLGLRGGGLYHHLKELMLQGLIKKESGKYVTTGYGTLVLSVALNVAILLRRK